MIKDLTIEATLRDRRGKGQARQLRATGMLPVAVYGEGLDSAAVAVNTKDIANILRSGSGHNTIFKVAIPGYDPATVIIKDYQVDPVKGRLLHADLMRLSLTTATRVSVNIEFVGEPVGVKLEGGILELELREVEVECLPMDIPEKIRVDVSEVRLGKHVTVAELIYDRDKIKILTPNDQIIAGVLAPRMVEEVAAPEAEAAEAAEAPAGEPEVIKKGKTEERA
ncbi:MAG TPA: 50S ribosomal protein L25 [Blastocatellia bacterium]|jgi:large subunit ribosomal protein L25|nr:50S ribosomal protein L25 [Blastocatellia bacterium]